MRIRNITVEVPNPDHWTNPPIMEHSGHWVEIATHAIDHLMPGDYPANRTLHTKKGEVLTSGILRIRDDRVEWVETIFFATK